MVWKRKKSKWLVVENMKVHCYLCGKKMLSASERMYNAETGHYSHASCARENNFLKTNGRRSAVKIIVASAGIVGLTAVGVNKFTGFGNISNSIFSSKSSGKSNAREQSQLETVITSQGIILPSLTSDPANPVAGQMWYRSDAGVTAHFDSIQNRVVYSSEINNGNVNVTSKGIVNGLSVLPNDGTGGFGPDTTLDASSVGEIGSPYTQTSGINESVNYVYNQGGGHIKLGEGIFQCNGNFQTGSSLTGLILVPPVPAGTSPVTEMMEITIEGYNKALPQYYQYGASSSTSGFPYKALTKGYSIISTTNTSSTNTNVLFGVDYNANDNEEYEHSNVSIRLDGIIFRQPANPTFTSCDIHYAANQWVNIAIDIWDDDGLFPTPSGQVGNSGIGFYGQTLFQNYNAGENVYENIFIQGYNIGMITAYEHLVAEKIAIQYCNTAIQLTEMADKIGTIYYLDIENCIYAFDLPGWVGNPSQPLIILSFDLQINTSSSQPFIFSGLLNNTWEYFNCKIYNIWVVPNMEITALPGYSTIQDTPFLTIHDLHKTVQTYLFTLSLTSGTPVQNNFNMSVMIHIPITYPATASRPSSAQLRVGLSSTAGDNPVVDQLAAPDTLTTASGNINELRAIVSAGQYIEVDVSNATIGTASLQPLSE